MTLKAVALGLLFAFLWSSAFASARVIVAQAPPLTSLALRFLLAGMIGIAVARASGQSWHLDRGQWRATLIFGICQNALYLGLFFVAMQWIEAGFASIIASTMPLMVGAAGWLLLGERLRGLAILGLLLGFVGTALIMGTRIEAGSDPLGILLCLLGAAALSVATLTARGATSGGNVLMVVGLQMLVGSACLAVAALLLEDWQVTWTWQLIVAFLYTTLFPGLIATWVWFTLVNMIGAVRAATFHFLNPFFGVLVAAVVLGERIGPLDVVGVLIVMAGILAVQLAKQAPAR
ncbi:DMT family transporter [Pseudooceanicola aestuarii]|uniref:DMT family transporter n=1 Tax=Pseudooceanicola aestuarii TaxID=2697319 RepID=UPI0013D58DDD|nr:DMT family transporter [Pseudooceanicola aestuarii]